MFLFDRGVTQSVAGEPSVWMNVEFADRLPHTHTCKLTQPPQSLLVSAALWSTSCGANGLPVSHKAINYRGDAH